MDFPKEKLSELLDKHDIDKSLLDSLPDFLEKGGLSQNKDIVGIEEFITNPNYLNARTSKDQSVIYPKVMEELVKINSGKYSEVVFVGGIGTAKTTSAIYTQLYQLYKLSCLTNPHELFGLDPASEIVIIMQSLNKAKAKDIDFKRFKSSVESSPYFQKYFPHRKDIESQLLFPHNIVVKPIAGDVAGSIGENVIGGIIDEVNFMDVVEKSKRTHDGATYNQAEVLYSSLARRRESRFMYKGELPGIICMVSSKRYPGEFTDLKIAEAKTDPSIYVYDKRIWEVKPDGTFSKERFYVFTGTESENPFILTKGDAITDYDESYILKIPVDFLKQFEIDILDALREIGGKAVRSVNPFILDVKSISDAFRTSKGMLSRNTIDFAIQKMGIDPTKFVDKEFPRFIHIDIGLTNDHLGIACGYCPGFKAMDRGEGLIEYLPKIDFDFAIDVLPPKNSEIDLSKIRALIYKLYDLGLNIRWISMDSYQSADMIQRLRQRGFKAGLQSVDINMDPYIATKIALIDRRVSIPYHSRLEQELINLEVDTAHDKIDHPPHGSKDIADCVAGVIYGLCRQKHIWLQYGISVAQMNNYAEHFKKRESKPLEDETYMDALRRLKGQR